jgi:EmrB/QacA subfamily drug resistance transporter
VADFGEGNRHWWILAAMSGVLGLVVLDETVVGVALPTMRHDLGMSQVAAHWAVNAYLLTFTCFVAIGGRLGDDYGHRDVFVAGIAIFGLASLAAGTAPAGGWLIAGRAAQGIGAAVIFPSSWAMMTATFPPEQRGTAFGIQTTVGGIFMATGPLIGGFFAQSISWRWIFWVNLPVVAAIAVAVMLVWKPSFDTGRRAAAGRFDAAGLVTLIVSLVALVIALMEGSDWGWDAPLTLALLGGGVVLLVLFIVTELHRADPLIELGLLRNATFTGGTLVFFMFQFNKIVVFIFVPLYLQDVLHRSPVVAGLAVMIAVLPTLVTSLASGRLTDRYGSRWPLLAGLVLNGLAVVFLGFATVLDSYALIVAPLFVWGAMLPFLAVPSRRALMGAAPKSLQSQASGVNLTIQMLGGTIGMALCGTLYATTGSFRLVFLVTGAVVLATILVAWFWIERPNQHR